MSPSEEFIQGLVCGILIGLFILLLETETRPDRNNHQQEQSARKRGPEENDDTFSWEGIGLKWKVFNWVNCVGISTIIEIQGHKLNIINEIYKKKCAENSHR